MTRARLRRFYPAALVVLFWGVALGQPSASADDRSDTALPRGFDRAVVIPIHKEITEVTFDSVQRRIERIRADKSPLVLIELDTPGGALGPTLEICRALKDLRDSGVRVYAWVNKQAYSAGTIIALATEGILMAPNASLGDCQPISLGVEGAGAVSESIEAKVLSPLLAELRDSARRNGYDMDMLLALIRPEVQLYWVENTATGERRFVDASTRDELFGVTAQTQPADPRRTVESRTTWRYVENAPPLGKIRQPVDDARELLTLSTEEALTYGLSLATAGSVSELRELFGVVGAIERMENSTMESIVSWLAQPAVRSILFLLMVMGFYVEFHTPGFGLAGTVGLTAMALFLGAPYLAGFAVGWEVVLVLLGLALLVVEIFVLPGSGVAGIVGLCLLGVGLLASFIPEEPGSSGWPQWPTLPMSYAYLQRGVYSLAAGLVGSLAGMWLLARYLPRARLATRLIPPNPSREEIEIDDPYDGIAQVGDIGRTEGPLRPAGKARFGAVLVDVVSEGEYIDKSVRVEVTRREGNRVVVRRID